MERMVAYCGLVCTECKGYLATQANDLEALQKLAEQAIKDFGAPPTTTAESVKCDGCLSNSARKCGYCAVCEIRLCGVARGVANCALCDDYGCAKITGFIANVAEAKATLEAIRQQGGAAA